MSVLINGSLSKPFSMERGLRQGDPLSSFLFILVAKVLNKMVVEAEQSGIVEGLLVGKDKVALSHLQFMDDIIFFCSTKKEVGLKFYENFGLFWNHVRIIN